MVVFDLPDGSQGTFIHIPKTGGSFVKQILEARCNGKTFEGHAPAHVAQFRGYPHPFVACRRPSAAWYLSVWRSRMPHQCDSLREYGAGSVEFADVIEGLTGRRDCFPKVPGLFVGGMPRPYQHQGGLHRLYEVIFGAGLIDVWLDTPDLNDHLGDLLKIDLGSVAPVNISNRGFKP